MTMRSAIAMAQAELDDHGSYGRVLDLTEDKPPHPLSILVFTQHEDGTDGLYRLSGLIAHLLFQAIALPETDATIEGVG